MTCEVYQHIEFINKWGFIDTCFADVDVFRIWTQKKLMVAIFCLSTFTFFICLIDGPHQSVSDIKHVLSAMFGGVSVVGLVGLKLFDNRQGAVALCWK